MVHPGYRQVYNAGVLEFISSDVNSLLFSFDMTLAGGEYQCININSVHNIGSAGTSYLDVCYHNINYKSRWVADLELLFTVNGEFDSSRYFGGNDVGANYGAVQVAQWNHALYQQYTTDQVTFTGQTLLIPAGWNNVCIFNACGRNAYCPETQRMYGQFRVRAAYTTSQTTTNSVVADCPLAEFDGIVPTLSPATTPAPYSARPTVTSKPSKRPSHSPSRQPTTLPECISECSATDSPSYSPAWIPPTHYPTHLKPYSHAPDATIDSDGDFDGDRRK